MNGKTIHNMPFNAEKAKEKGFEWFCMICDDYATRKVPSMLKASKADMKKVFEKLTGQQIKQSNTE